MKIDHIPPDQIDAVVEDLLRDLAIPGKRHSIALIDHSFRHEIDLLAEWRWGDPVNLFGRLSNGERKIAPLLLQIPDTEHERRAGVRLLVSTCNGAPMLSFLESALPLEALGAHLATLVRVQLPPDGQSWLLRFADTRIIPLLSTHLDPQQRHQFFGPLFRWKYSGRNAQWSTLNGGGVAAMPPPGPLALTERQFGALIAACLPDNLLPTICEHSSSFAAELPSVQYRLVCHWIDEIRDAEGGGASDAECLSHCLEMANLLPSEPAIAATRSRTSI